MGIRTNILPRAEKRIPLKRPGSKGGENRPARRDSAPKRSFSISFGGLPKLSGFFLTAGIISLGLILLSGVSVGLIYGYRAVTTGAYFSLKNIEIQGSLRIPSREILETTGLDKGPNTLAISIDAVEGILLRNPWVREASVKRVLPDTIIVTIKEKDPAFWRLKNGILMYADARGETIAPVMPGNFTSLPTLEVDPGAEAATRRLPDLVRSLRDSELSLDMSSISWVRLSAARGVEIFVEDTKLQISIGLEEWLLNLQRLGKTIADLKKRGELEYIRSIKAEGSSVWVEKKTRRVG